MKITKSQLKQIIKEELEAAMDEGFLDRFKKTPSYDRPEFEPDVSSPTLRECKDLFGISGRYAPHNQKENRMIRRCKDLYPNLKRDPVERPPWADENEVESEETQVKKTWQQ